MPEDAADEPHFSSRTIGGRSVDTSTWATPDEGALAGTARARYFARKSAVALYLAGADEDEILKKSGIGAKQTYRLVRERCLQVHPDGQPYGWRALVPYLRIKPYERHRPIRVSPFGTGAAGVFTAMLDRHPDLRKKLDHRILREASPDKLSEIKITRKNHWRWFKDQLRALGSSAKNVKWELIMRSSLPERIDLQHHILTRRYAVWTPPMDEMIGKIGDWIDMRIPGGYIFGPSRFGKTRCVRRYLCNVLTERFRRDIPSSLRSS